MFNKFCHYLAGFISIFGVIVSPVVPVISTILFIVYELNEDWHIKDGAWKDIVEYMRAFFVGIVILLIWRLL